MGTTRIDLNELQMFERVAETLSFTQAARELDAPKSTISRAMRRLEARLGVRLLERTTRTVNLTEAGEIYLERCRRVLEDAEEADLAIGALLAHPRGTLRIGAPVMFARAILAPSLGEFLRRFPDVRLRIKVLASEAEVPRGLDVVIRSGVLEDSDFRARTLIRVHIGTYASPDYFQHHEMPRVPADLRQLDCIATSCDFYGEPAQSSLWRLRKGTDVREVRVDARVSAPDPVICHQLACAGIGIARLSHWLARADVESGRLVRILPEWEPDPVDLHALYSGKLATAPKVRVFLEYMREYLAQFNKNGEGDSARMQHPPDR